MTDLPRLFNDLVRFETELWNGVDARLREELDLPLARFEPMQMMARLPACRVHDISNGLSITVGGTSKIVDRIEAAGHCRRKRNPGDRRSSLLVLTPAGKRLLAKATDIFEDELEVRLGTPLSARALQQFGSTLTKLRAVEHADLADEGTVKVRRSASAAG